MSSGASQLAGASRHADLDDPTLCLAHIAPIAIRWLLIVGGALHFAQNAFTLAQFLEAAHQLLNGFIGTGAYLNHAGQ